MSKLKPIFKWAGGKHRISEWIFDKFPATFTHYWEMFAGGAAVSLYVYEHSDVQIYLNDANEDLIYFYEVLKTKQDELLDCIKEIHKIFQSSTDKRVSYNYYRDQFNELDKTNVCRLAIFYFLNKTSFNGLTRYNSKGEFNVPWGQRDFFPDYEDLINFNKFLNDSRVHLRSSDYLCLLPNDEDMLNHVVYLDPPYHPISVTSSFTSYYKKWGDEDEVELRKFCDRLIKNGVVLFLSNNDVPFIRDLFKGYIFYTLEVTKSVGAKKETRKKSKEVLITI